MFFQIIVIVVVISRVSSNYNGYKVVGLSLTTDREINIVLNLREQYQLDIWNGPSKVIETQIMIKPQQLSLVLDSLTKHGIHYKILIEDVENHLHKYSDSNRSKRNVQEGCNPISNVHDHFATYDEIITWTTNLERANNFVSNHIYGKTLENRDLIYVKISTKSNKKIIIVDAGIHAREWLAVSTLNYILEKIIQQYKVGDPLIVKILSKYDIYFIPVFNPDGYAFTHTEGNRLWRKNKKPFLVNNTQCYGVDLNRNFDADFGGAGTSSNECSDLYRGPHAFSELETIHFSELVKTLGTKIKLFFSLHAYSQLWIVPYAYTMTPPSDDMELRRVANIGARALYNIHNKTYTIGTVGAMLYNASGSAMDWMKLKAGVKYAYTLEVRPDMKSEIGFIPPTTFINLTGEEVYAGFKTTIQAMDI